MQPQHTGTSPCVNCPLQSTIFCRSLQKQPDPDRNESAQHGLRRSFAGAAANQTIYARGETSDDIYILCYGWAFAVAPLNDGRRQILNVLMAGDMFSAHMAFEGKLDFSIQALTAVRYARINRDDLKVKLFADPQILDALTRICAAERRAANNMIIDLGRRSADERIAHLILNITERIGLRSVIREQTYTFPLRQQDIADMSGLTPVHVSRVLGKFRQANLIEMSGGKLRINNIEELRRIGLPR